MYLNKIISVRNSFTQYSVKKKEIVQVEYIRKHR